jgi:hypothetical protein
VHARTTPFHNQTSWLHTGTHARFVSFDYIIILPENITMIADILLSASNTPMELTFPPGRHAHRATKTQMEV